MELLQGVLWNRSLCQSLRAVPGCGIGTSSLRKGEFFQAVSAQPPWEGIISFEAARLVINPVLLIALLGEILLDRPRPGPHRRVFHRDLVRERSRPGARPALDQVQVLARALIIGFRTEVRHVDDEGIALPMAARIAVPLANAGRQVRAAIHDDVALPALALISVIEHRDAAWRLDDPEEVVAVRGSKFGQSARQAALRQCAVLRTIVAID